MRKVILTKKRLKALNMALSVDDILYEKFLRLNKDFMERCEEWNRRKQVVRVVQKKDNVNYILQITKEIKTEEGIILEVI